jgi:uncharacterized membrane protein YcaP (DUF421 family)
MLFNGWAGVLRVAVVGVLAYVALLALLRVLGKRGLTTMTPFDYIGTVAIGSTLANTLLSKDIVLAEGVAGFVVLLGVQWVISWLAVRSPMLDRIVNPEPTLLLHRGRPLYGPMRKLRITRDQILASARAHGFARLEDIDAMVLEPDGSLSVLRRGGDQGSALADVPGP